MTKEERKRFDNTRRDLQENPVKAMLFYAHYGTKETANETCDNPFVRIYRISNETIVLLSRSIKG